MDFLYFILALSAIEGIAECYIGWRRVAWQKQQAKSAEEPTLAPGRTASQPHVAPSPECDAS